MSAWKRKRLGFSLAFALAALTFLLDLVTPLGMIGGIPYVALILIALVTRHPQSAWWLALLGSALTVAGFFASPSQIAPEGVAILNRTLAVLAVWATAFITHLHLKSLAELEPLAEHDELTGLYNRRYLDREIEKQIGIWKRYGNVLSLIMLDIDHFKRINDRYGHAAGDRVLAALADTLREHTREIDTVCRYGGEEFLILLPFTDLDGAIAKAEHIRQAVAGRNVRWVRKSISYRVSQGVVQMGETTDSAVALLAAADQALYQAKNAGRDRVVAAQPPRRTLLRRRKTDEKQRESWQDGARARGSPGKGKTPDSRAN